MSSEDRWGEAKDALCGIAQRAMEYNTHGVDIQFLNSQLIQSGVKVSIYAVFVAYCS